MDTIKTNADCARMISQVVDYLDVPQRREMCPSSSDSRNPLLDELVLLAAELDPPAKGLWEIRGHSPKSGNPCTIRVRADDYFDAKRRAARSKMVIRDIVLIEEGTARPERKP